MGIRMVMLSGTAAICLSVSFLCALYLSVSSVAGYLYLFSFFTSEQSLVKSSPTFSSEFPALLNYEQQ